MKPLTLARAWRERIIEKKVKQQKTKLTYSTTSGISGAAHRSGTLIVCIIQVLLLVQV
jgi:hypothetical protein